MRGMEQKNIKAESGRGGGALVWRSGWEIGIDIRLPLPCVGWRMAGTGEKYIGWDESDRRL